MIEPLVVDFSVGAPIEHAFRMWTERAALWWPRSHTVSGEARVVVFEPRIGGRIYEQSSSGDQHEWGEVLDWDPPHRLRYLWHLFFPRAEATVVEVTFTATGEGTGVRLVQTGWDALGDQGLPRRRRTYEAWTAISERYADMVD